MNINVVIYYNSNNLCFKIDILFKNNFKIYITQPMLLRNNRENDHTYPNMFYINMYECYKYILRDKITLRACGAYSENQKD